jgi:hypothetical protein
VKDAGLERKALGLWAKDHERIFLGQHVLRGILTMGGTSSTNGFGLVRRVPGTEDRLQEFALV